MNETPRGAGAFFRRRGNETRNQKVNVQKKEKLFYGWIVCGVCTLLLFVTMGTVSNGLSVFMPYIMKSYGLTNAQTSSLVMLRCVWAFVAMLLIDRYYERVGFRAGTGIAALCGTAAFLIYSFATGYFGFCVGASMAGICYGLGSMIPVSILMNRWFVRHRALTIGICSAGSGAASIILPPILTGIILRASLRAAFYFVAAYVFVFAVLIFLLVRDDPASKGLQPLGREELYMERRKHLDSASPVSETAGLSAGTWLLLAGLSVSMGALANPGYMHLTMLYTSEGFSPMTVALLLSVCGIVLTAFKVVFGQVTDVIGGFRSTAVFAVILIAGHVLCCLAFAQSVPLAMLSVILLGIGYPISTVGIPVWAGDLTGADRFADTVRKMQLCYAAGAMVFASVPGIMADRLGGYIPVYAVFAALAVVSLLCLIVVYRGRMTQRQF